MIDKKAINVLKAINERRAAQISEAISSPEQRVIMYARMWFPLERTFDGPYSDETELQWAERKINQLELAADRRRLEEIKVKRRRARARRRLIKRPVQ